MTNRFPALKEVVPVYAVINFLVVTWAIAAYLWQLPAWLHFLGVSDLLIIFSYLFYQTMLESLLFLGILLAVCAILPSRFLREAFVARATWISFVFLACLFLVIYWHTLGKLEGGSQLGIGFTVSLAASSGMAFLSSRLKALSSFALWFSDSLVLFLYFLVPISLISVLVVLGRNIF